MIEKTGERLVVGRIQFNIADEAQIRYMVVADKFQGKGLRGQIISFLENVAPVKGSKQIIL